MQYSLVHLENSCFGVPKCIGYEVETISLYVMHAHHLLLFLIKHGVFEYGVESRLPIYSLYFLFKNLLTALSVL